MYSEIWIEAAKANDITVEELRRTLKAEFSQEDNGKIPDSTLSKFKLAAKNLNRLLTRYFNPPPEEIENWPIIEEDEVYLIELSDELALLYEPYRQEDDEEY